MFVKRNSFDLPNSDPAKGSTTAAQDADANAKPPEKTPEEERLEKIEKKAAEQNKQETLEKLEQLEFLKFPNIMGWYFDGQFCKSFTLHEEYAEYFNEIEDEQDAQKDLIIEETFTERAFRNFWPPKFYGGKYFRTRGIYLDFKEVKEDPPKTPPNINYEKQRGVIGVETGLDPTTDMDQTDGLSQNQQTYGPPGHLSSKDNWYWNEQKRDFKPKEPDGDYIWSDDERIWRENDPTYRTPYDWYFDEKQGRYFIRDFTHPEFYEFDQEKNIYKKVGVKGPSVNGLRHNDYFYDEKQRKWLPIGKSHGHLKVYHNGMREVAIGGRGRSGLTPDDFYYDGETGKMEHKDDNDHHEYYYDTHDKMFKKKNQPYGPGKANHYPLDYEFDLKLGKYVPKPAKECRHIEPYDWYWDADHGKFYRIDRANRNKYVYDAGQNLYLLKDAKGPSANELRPEDYYWDENSREWKLTITVKDLDTLEFHEPGKRKIVKGERGKSDKVPDDFYYDAYDGSFFRKDQKKLNAYWYDIEDEVWKKRGQHYGPGYLQLYPYHFYFDYDEGFWFPTVTAKQILAKQRRGEVKGLSDRTPYDFAFNDQDGEFQLRDKNNPRWYKYNPTTGVFHKEGPKGPSNNGKTPKDYFFDEFTCTWLPLEHPKGHEARDYKNGRRNNRVGPRGKSGKISDDYYFSFTEGLFHLKDTETEYEYLPDYGVWMDPKELGPLKPNDPKILQTTDYYFDREEGQFLPKKKLEYGEIHLNPNTHLWIQSWRCPPDYYWEPRQSKYLRKTAAMIEKEMNNKHPKLTTGATRDKNGLEQTDGELLAEKKKKTVLDYERPWLHNFLDLAADEIRFEQELLKQTERTKKPKYGKAAKSVGDDQGGADAEPKTGKSETDKLEVNEPKVSFAETGKVEPSELGKKKRVWKGKNHKKPTVE